ncbi:MAG: hypothetical protein WA888_04445 [Burkholderiaceae bacterium]
MTISFPEFVQKAANSVIPSNVINALESLFEEIAESEAIPVSLLITV